MRYATENKKMSNKNRVFKKNMEQEYAFWCCLPHRIFYEFSFRFAFEREGKKRRSEVDGTRTESEQQQHLQAVAH